MTSRETFHWVQLFLRICMQLHAWRVFEDLFLSLLNKITVDFTLTYGETFNSVQLFFFIDVGLFRLGSIIFENMHADACLETIWGSVFVDLTLTYGETFKLSAIIFENMHAWIDVWIDVFGFEINLFLGVQKSAYHYFALLYHS